MAFTKQPKVEKPYRGGCMHCPGNHDLLEMDTVLYQGFGGWHVEKNGEIYYSGDPQAEWETFKTLAQIELEAAKEPDADWQVHLNNPLRDGVWQRHGASEWVLIKSGPGFV